MFTSAGSFWSGWAVDGDGNAYSIGLGALGGMLKLLIGLFQ